MSGPDDLSFGEPESIAPKKMARKTAALPAPLAAAFDSTPVGEARTLRVELAPAADPAGVGKRLVALLKRHAAAQGMVAYKAAYLAGELSLELYWQKKRARSLEPDRNPW